MAVTIDMAVDRVHVMCCGRNEHLRQQEHADRTIQKQKCRCDRCCSARASRLVGLLARMETA